MVNPRWRLPAGGNETAIWVAKIAFCFLGLLSVGAAARAAVPVVTGAFASFFPGIRAALLSRIRPPYLFIAVHFIILAIWKIKSFESSRSSNINRMPSPDIWSDEIPQSPRPEAVSSPDLAEPSASDESCLTTNSVERSTASSMSSIERSAEPEEEEDATAALEIAGVENDSMEATWKVITEQPSRTAASPSAAASPSPSRRDYRRLDPPSAAALPSPSRRDYRRLDPPSAAPSPSPSRRDYRLLDPPSAAPLPSPSRRDYRRLDPPSAAASPSPSRRDYRRLDPPSAAALPSPSRRDYRRLDPPPPPAVHDEFTQRVEEFIKKNHQQIRFPTS